MSVLIFDQFRPGTRNGCPCWRPPAGCLGTIDLSSAARTAGEKPDSPRWGALFVCRDVPADIRDTEGVVLCEGDLRAWRPDTAQLAVIGKRMGYTPRGDTGPAVVWDLLTSGADPAGLDRPFPLVPDARRRMRIYLGSSVLRRRYRWSDKYTVTLCDLWRRQLAESRRAALAGEYRNARGQVDHTYHRQIADALVEKHAGPDPKAKRELFARIKPREWSFGECLLPHETSYTDNFNRSDGGVGSNWSQVYVGWVISSNRIVNTAVSAPFPGVIGYVSALSSADQYSQIDVIDGPGAASDTGPLFRGNAAHSTAYLFALDGDGTNIRLYKIVSAVFTELGNAGSAFSTPDTARGYASGTTIRGYINGVSALSLTDSAIDGSTVGGKYVGIYGEAATSIADNFAAGDLSEATQEQFGGMVSPQQAPKRIINVVGY